MKRTLILIIAPIAGFIIVWRCRMIWIWIITIAIWYRTGFLELIRWFWHIVCFTYVNGWTLNVVGIATATRLAWIIHWVCGWMDGIIFERWVSFSMICYRFPQFHFNATSAKRKKKKQKTNLLEAFHTKWFVFCFVDRTYFKPIRCKSDLSWS